MADAEEDSSAFGIDLEKLSELDLDQLQEIAAAAEVTVPAPMKNNKKSLATYLKNQLKKRLAQ
jgi:hypothetical protein